MAGGERPHPFGKLRASLALPPKGEKKGKVVRVAIVLFLLMLAAALGGCDGPQADPPSEASVRIGGEVTYAVDMAVTPEERQQGLSGRETMAQNAGMLFIFEEEQPLHFWMKDMRFPLDIIWIDGQCRLIDVSADVPTPPPNARNDEIPRVQSPSPARYVLELNAGEWARAGLSPGDPVEFLGTIEGQYGC